MREFDAVIPYVYFGFLNIPNNVHIICILYVFVNPKYYILEVSNWHLKMIFHAVANCDRLDFLFDIAICDVIYLIQNKKADSF
jgi:hypothetical protein